MQKAKHRTKAASASSAPQNSNGSHLSSWMPGDPPELHPLFSSFGAFKDDPFWDEFVQAMDEERRKIDEQAVPQDKQNVRT